MSEWISVKDRLPEKEWKRSAEEDGYEIFPLLAVAEYETGDRYVTKLYYTGKKFVNVEYTDFTKYITHWMPLPEPPKED